MSDRGFQAPINAEDVAAPGVKDERIGRPGLKRRKGYAMKRTHKGSQPPQAPNGYHWVFIRQDTDGAVWKLKPL